MNRSGNRETSSAISSFAIRDSSSASSRSGDALDRRIGCVDDLNVPLTCPIHHAASGVEIEQGGHHALHILEAHLGRRNRQPPLVVPGSDDVVEYVDFHERMALGPVD